MLDKVYGNIKYFFSSIGRFFYWGWKLRHSHDFDASYLLEMISLKLTRMRKSFINHGHTTWIGKGTLWRKFVVAEQIAKRLIEREYSESAYKELDEVWGEYSFKLTPTKSKNYSTFSSTRANIKNEKDKERYLKHSMRLYEKAREQQKFEKKYLFDFLAKYSDYLWD